MIWTRAFWKGAGERCLKTYVQTFMAVLTLQLGAHVTPQMALELPWATSATTAGIAALYSLFTSIGNADHTAGNTGPRRALQEY